MSDSQFSFGKNWDDFLRHSLDSDRIAVAIRDTSGFLGLSDLKGLTFMDIGCGSGLFSYVAHSMAAEHKPGIVLQSPPSDLQYKNKRGMSWRHDIVDWLGGYPYEFASAGQVFEFCHRELGLTLERLNTTSSIGCNEFLFSRPPAPTRADSDAHSPRSSSSAGS